MGSMPLIPHPLWERTEDSQAMGMPQGWSEARDQEEWDDFVTHNGGSAFHLWSWRKALEGSGMKPVYLAYRGSEGIVAVCPFFCRSGRHLRYLDSLPHSNTSGPVVGDHCDDPSRAMATLPRSVRFSLSNPVVAMRVRTHQGRVIGLLEGLRFEHRQTTELFLLDLSQSKPERIWNESFNKHDRQAVKHYEERAEFRFVGDPREYLALARPDWRYYDGAERGFIPKIMENLGDRASLALAVDATGTPLAGFLMLFDPQSEPDRTVHLLAVRYSTEDNIHSPVTYLNWMAVNWAREKGFHYVDFGSYPRTRSSNPSDPFCKLKLRFGIRPVPRCEFILPVSSVPYSIAKDIRRVVYAVSGFQATRWWDRRVRFATSPPLTVASISLRGPYSQAGEAMLRLKNWTDSKHLEAAGYPFCLFYDNPSRTAEADLRSEVCIPVSKPFVGEGEVTMKELPEVEVAETVHQGPPEEFARTYRPFIEGLLDRGYSRAGPAREYFRSVHDVKGPGSGFVIRQPISKGLARVA